MAISRRIWNSNFIYFTCGVLITVIFMLIFKPTHIGVEDHAISQGISEMSSNCPSCSLLCERQAKLFKLRDCKDVLSELNCNELCPEIRGPKIHPAAKGGKLRSVTAENEPPEMDEDWDPETDDVPTRRLPKALILGFSRCGTTALKRFLALHPDVEVLDWDISYFCDVHYYMYTLTWYRKMMPVTYSNHITIDKSPCYINEKAALQRIQAFNSSIKLIISMGDPITRIESIYGQLGDKYKQFGTKPKPIDEYILKPDGALNTDFIQKSAVYSNKVAEVFKLFPKKQIHIVDADMLVTDPLHELTKIESFLGLKHYLSDEDLFFNKTKGFYCWRFRDTGNTDCLSPYKGRKHVKLEPELEVSLRRYLKPFNEDLFQIIGRRFDWEE